MAIDALKEKYKKIIEDLKTKFEWQVEAIISLGEDILKISSQFDTSIAQSEKKLSGLKEKINKTINKVNEINKKVNTINNKVTDVEDRLIELE